MRSSDNIHVVVTGPGAGACGALIEAMRREGWNVSVMEDIKSCAAAASSIGCHMAVVACGQVERLEKKPVRSLLGLGADMSVVFLVPEDWRQDKSGALAGVTFDQAYSMSTPTAELMEVFKDQLRCVLDDQAQYAIVCVDDDKEFLASLKAFLPAHLRAASSRFDLDFEFFAEPAEALAACRQISQEQLAVVVSDQVMPDITGIELLTGVKELHPNSKRVLLTGHAGLGTAVEAINDHILHKYVFKPVDPVDFSESIRLLLSEYHLGLTAERRRNRMMAQFEYIRAITAAREIGEVLRDTQEFLCEQVQPAHALMALMQDGQLVLRTANSPLGGLSIGQPLPADGSIWDWLSSHRRSICAGRKEDLPEDAECAFPLPVMAAPLIRDKALLGAVLLAGRADGGSFSREEGMLMNFVADVVSVAIGSFEDRKAIERSYVSTMASLMETVEAKDSYTRGHTERVMQFASELAKAIGVTGPALQEIEWAAALHDIGKIAVPDAVLIKPSSLTADEYAIVKEHPIRADKILQHLKYLDAARMMIRSHHEAYDSSGYPDRLAGEEIPLGARILAIADSYDAMTSMRSYRDAMSPSEALKEIETNAGKQFDPRLVATFQEVMRSRSLWRGSEAASGNAFARGSRT